MNIPQEEISIVECYQMLCIVTRILHQYLSQNLYIPPSRTPHGENKIMVHNYNAYLLSCISFITFHKVVKEELWIPGWYPIPMLNGKSPKMTPFEMTLMNPPMEEINTWCTSTLHIGIMFKLRSKSAKCCKRRCRSEILRTDERTDGRTNGHHEHYIPPTWRGV